MAEHLWIVEYDDGEMYDCTGDGGFSVWLSEAEAVDAKESAGEGEEFLTPVKFVRASDLEALRLENAELRKDKLRLDLMLQRQREVCGFLVPGCVDKLRNIRKAGEQK